MSVVTESASRPARRKTARVGSLLGSMLLGACSVFGIRTAEEPPYEVITSEDDFEIRAYPESVVATTVVQVDDYDKSGSVAFNRLGGYIFGDNRKAGSDESEKIAMTAPVIQEKSEKGWVATFVMPSEWSRDSLPDPTDPTVELRNVPGRKVASIRYTGLVTEKKIEEQAAKLRAWVESQGMKVLSPHRSARYDPPWTIPFLRRNEVHVDVE
jgi:effector-binding domain-containing protein